MFKKNTAGSMNNIIGIVIAVILGFAILFLGAYINGEINTGLTRDFGSNQSSGEIDYIYWHNTTVVETTRNITLPTDCEPDDLDTKLTYITITANDSNQITFDLTVNGNPVNRTTTIAGGSGASATITLDLLLTQGNVTGSHTYLCFVFTVNSSQNQVQIHATGNYYKSSDYRTPKENTTWNRMNNVSSNFDGTVDIVQVVIIIIVLAVAIGAIFLFTRFGR